ncbi:hypothetical protein DBV14_16050 [Variovorax sp. KBW07]|nr:hypothetical protein DBV14_16050 [Variovorax sp. KBW07]
MTNQTPLLLLPGLMNDERVWDPVRKALPTGRDVVVSSTHTADTIPALAASALAAMPSGKFAVAGFSLGGYVALEVCRQAGQRVAGVALLDTGARADSEEAMQNRRRMVAALETGNASFAQVRDTGAACIACGRPATARAAWQHGAKRGNRWVQAPAGGRDEPAGCPRRAADAALPRPGLVWARRPDHAAGTERGNGGPVARRRRAGRGAAIGPHVDAGTARHGRRGFHAVARARRCGSVSARRPVTCRTSSSRLPGPINPPRRSPCRRCPSRRAAA